MIGVIIPVLVTTDDMVADILTKPLDRSKLGKFRTYMLNYDRGPGTTGALSANARRAWKHIYALIRIIDLSLAFPVVRSSGKVSVCHHAQRRGSAVGCEEGAHYT